MALRIGFFTTLGVNVGDEFIREGIRQILDRTGVPYEPYYVNKHDPASLHQPAEDEVRRLGHKFWEADLFIQAGAPVYWHLTPHTSVTCEWQSWFWEALVLTDQPPAPPPTFINLGAGACQDWDSGPDVFMQDAACVSFARAVANRSRLTTVRDPLAARLLTALDIPHHALPCPAFLAAGRHHPGGTVPGLIGINLMPLASHWNLHESLNLAAWTTMLTELLPALRRSASLIFICHDEAEAAFAQTFCGPGERIFHAAHWRTYLEVYSQCEVVLANRIHGAVGAAGFGVPAVVIGNDSRAEVMDFLGLPRLRAVNLTAPVVLAAVAQLRRTRRAESERLLQLRESATVRYVELLRPILQETTPRTPARASR